MTVIRASSGAVLATLTGNSLNTPNAALQMAALGYVQKPARF